MGTDRTKIIELRYIWSLISGLQPAEYPLLPASLEL